MYFIYVLKSKKDSKLYTGITKNIIKRLQQHNSGKNFSTKYRAPFKLIYKEVVNDRIEARKREKFLKSGSGRELLRDLTE